MVFTEQARLAFAKTHRAALTTSTALHLAHKKPEDRDNNEYRKACHQQLIQEARLLNLAPFNSNVVVIQIINKLGILHLRTYRFKCRAISIYPFDNQTIYGYLFYPIFAYAGDKI